MIVYNGSPNNARELIQFFRFQKVKLQMLRKLIVTPEKTIVRDVNGDTLEFQGLTYGSPVLEDLLRELGVVFLLDALRNPNPQAILNGVMEFDLSACWTWGHG
jgi:hypothetical protein